MRTPESEMSPTRSWPPAAETSSIRALRRTYPSDDALAMFCAVTSSAPRAARAPLEAIERRSDAIA
jgi:hypothetical protein